MSEPKLALLCLCVAMTLGCSEGPNYVREEGERDRGSRIANLKRAATLPWTDDGRCAVTEASNEWPVLAERCYSALDLERIRFHDVTGRCKVASADAAAVGMTGLCVLAAPEIVVGAVVVAGVVVVAVLIKEALEEEEVRVAQSQLPKHDRSANRSPSPQGAGSDWFPPPTSGSPDPEDRSPECKPIPGPPLGGSDPHNNCADNIPGNDFPGLNVLVNGRHFDALQLATRTLWEVKTDNFEKQSAHSQAFFAKVKLPQIQDEARRAQKCGYNFVVGVRSAAQKIALEKLDRSLKIILMDWC